MKAKDTPGTLAAQESSPLTRPKNSKRKSSRATTYEPSSPSPMPKKTKTKGPKVLYKPSSPWDADCCAILLDKVIAHGVKTADLGAIAAELGVTKAQVVEQLKPDRSNVRQWAVQAVRGRKDEV